MGLMHKEESLERFRRQQRLSSGGQQLSIKGQDESGELRGRGQHASDSGYGTDSPGYSGHFPGHYRDPVRSLACEDIILTSDSESEDLHDALSVSSACDDDDVFVEADMMTVYFESPSARMTPKEHSTDRISDEMDDLDELDGDSPPKDNNDPIQLSHSGADLTELRGAVGGTRPRALPLDISSTISTRPISNSISNTISSAMDIPSSPRHRSPSVNFTPPRFYSGNTSFPFPPSPTLFGSPSESVFTFGRRAPPPSNLQRSLHIVALRERVFSESDMTRARTQSESAATTNSRQTPACFRDRSYSESAIQVRLQRRVGRELRRISDEFHVSYTSPSSSPTQNGMVRPEGMRTSRSFPGSSRGASWWQSIIQQFSPFFGQRLATIESPTDVIENPFLDNDSDEEGAAKEEEEPVRSRSRRQSRVTFDFSVGEMDDLDDEEDEVDGGQ